jgi:hypothetical protein
MSKNSLATEALAKVATLARFTWLTTFHKGHFIRETEKDIVSDYRYFFGKRRHEFHEFSSVDFGMRC